MKLTPLDIRHREFRRGLRGYSDEEVDVFLDEVADEFERVFQENIDLKERNQRLDEQVAQYVSLKETLQKTLITAQQQSDEMRANARKEAELVLRDADLKSRDIVNESYSEKQRVQQALIQLKQVEEEFRFKFRSLLEQYLNSLAGDEDSDDRRRFQGVVAGMQEAGSGQKQAPGGRPATTWPLALPVKQSQEEKRVVFGGAGGVSSVAPAGSAAAAASGASEPSIPASSSEELAASGAASAGESRLEPPAAAAAASAADVTAEGPVDALGAPLESPAASPTSAAQAEADVAAQLPAEAETPRWLWRGSAARTPVDAGEASTPAEAHSVTEEPPEEPTDQGLEKPRKESSVRRFLFGSKGDEGEDEFFGEQEDRDFQW